MEGGRDLIKGECRNAYQTHDRKSVDQHSQWPFFV